ncbi:hypothetical protein [Pseudarthrobacter cellobiosi]|uniref:hypothetical protein n=1 Tax=Pseudarthrobacter cellobiosi TaxID=2953654 RepID=UPI00208E69A5|nr:MULTISPECIES: hypothetical protein [unclassified Pseudarthrobacter]MCO4255243.1 hypothetical protein [Pseudarthrobacter sp. HLT1-5]MCO4275313.1 hypothetical protein [Pseudarthrobacter sp. HLT3-5]
MSAERTYDFIPCDDTDPWIENTAASAEVRHFARESLRWQAQEIIDEVLRGTAPGEELARARLRRCVAQNPGRPERALLQQLMINRDPQGESTQ